MSNQRRRPQVADPNLTAAMKKQVFQEMHAKREEARQASQQLQIQAMHMQAAAMIFATDIAINPPDLAMLDEGEAEQYYIDRTNRACKLALHIMGAFGYAHEPDHPDDTSEELERGAGGE